MKTNRFYMFLSVLASLITFFIVLYFVDSGYYLALISAIVIFLTITYIRLTINNKSFKYVMEKDSIFFFETFMMNLDTGYSIEDSLVLASNKNKSDIGRLFKIIYRNNKNKSFDKVLIEFKNTLKSLQLKNIVTEIINAYQMEEVTEDLKNQVDYLYETKLAYIKYEISNIPLLLATISLFLLVPLLIGIIFYGEVLSYLFR